MDVRKARYLRNNLTEAEQKLWYRLRKRQIAGCRFRRQRPISPYIVDFVCLERRLIIEVDGGQHQEHIEYDDKRTLWLEARGYRVLRFWNNDVLNNVDDVLQFIHSALQTEADKPYRGQAIRKCSN